MDFGTTVKHMAPFMVAILALCIPIVAIVMTQWAKVRRTQALNETVRLLAERGQSLPPELMSALVASSSHGEVKHSAGWNLKTQLLVGAINSGAGLGFMAFFLAMKPEGWLWAVGCIPLFIGLAILAVWRVESRQQPHQGA